MKTVIFAGGYGSRFLEFTKTKPKPMATIGEYPILYHIMQIYSKFGFNDFIIAAGYKSQIIKNYFVNFNILSSDLEINLKESKVNIINNKKKLDWNVKIIDTGKDTLTGKRLFNLKKYLKDETFFLTYGDGLSDINLNKLLNFHKKNNNVCTLTAVRPNLRFGELSISKNNIVNKFNEKKQLSDGWINGGFFVCNPEIFNFLNKSNEMFEKGPLQRLVNKRQLKSYKHHGFWQCMDNKREYDYLNELYTSNKCPWI